MVGMVVPTALELESAVQMGGPHGKQIAHREDTDVRMVPEECEQRPRKYNNERLQLSWRQTADAALPHARNQGVRLLVIHACQQDRA
jgi:hypothetical protein